MTKHPIIPPPELVAEWQATVAALGQDPCGNHLATLAAQWGAYQELDACCKWLLEANHGFDEYGEMLAHRLRAARRPKPPSAIEKAEALIERHEDGWVPNPAQWSVIREGLAEGRRALEVLPDD